MKRRITTVLIAVLSVSLLSACGTNYKRTFSDYWQQDVSIPIINNVSEVCEYNVKFTEGSNNTYAVNYRNGKYTTTFSSITNGETTVYTYTTALSIEVQYTVGSNSSEWFLDSTESTVTFQPCKKGLTPIASRKKMISHSPTAISINKLENAYSVHNLVVETEYDATSKKGTTLIIDNTKTENNTTKKTFSFVEKDYNYLDNEQLLFALRCLNPNDSASNRFQVYAPFNSAMQKINVQYGELSSATFNFAIDGVVEAKNIAYFPTTISLHSKDTNTGSDKTVWIAKTNSLDNNTYRNVILRQETPIAFALGTLVYELNSVKFA